MPCMENTALILLPRPSLCTVASLLTVADRGYSPPTPTPSTKRASERTVKRLSAPTGCAAADSAAPAMSMVRVAMKPRLLPSESASTPNDSWPTMEPTSTALASAPLSAALSWHTDDADAGYAQPITTSTTFITNRS